MDAPPSILGYLMLESSAVNDPFGRQFQQDIEFEWKPAFCAMCFKLGHDCAKATHEEKADRVLHEGGHRGEGQKLPDTGGGETTCPMTWIIWRGINKRCKQKERKQYLKENHIKIAGILENRVKENKAPLIDNKIVPGWERISYNRETRNGRIWVVWDAKAYNIHHLASTSQFIHCMVTGRQNGIDCILTVVYGFNKVEERKTLWDQLKAIASIINKLWLISRDFNAILHPSDRLSRTTISLVELKDFSECCNTLLLNEISWKGEYYTWTNKHRGNDRVCIRIDRAIANDE
ncbi:uncharacterized protein [Nicotiana sylvestris]|uniref:uncharacterized protein n=1 Tax=Nicotiana sylvestris TaxID=4096 RepID=UPI00388C56D0